MNARSKDPDPVRTNTELDYAPPWARESAREPIRPLSVERPAILLPEHDEIASDESQVAREDRPYDRPWHQRALEPELVPEPAGSISNFWPTMLRMGLVCTFAAVVAAAVVLLFNPKQSVHKGLQANAPPPSATAESKVSSFTEPAPIVPALTAERSASVTAPPPQLPPAQAPGASTAPQAVVSAMPSQPPLNVETPLAPAAQPVQPPTINQPSQQPLSTNSPIPVIPPPPSDASPPAQAATSPEPPPASSSAVKQSLARQAPTLDESEIATLIARGNKLLKDGDFAAARLLFERAANAGSAEGALALGSTYDPVVIKRLGAIAVKADVETARNWYQVAADRGSAAAKLQLANLPPSH
jgi:hypothetical protein